MADKRFLITISKELYEIIRKKAFEAHIPMNTIIKNILEKELKNEN
jgi:predicted DNA binding CopG/RHH family protein